jgi:hypothetical protein
LLENNDAKWEVEDQMGKDIQYPSYPGPEALVDNIYTYMGLI